jgi:MoaA/NifB/PqqE/SkfB family radical SAM enzyme
MKNKINLLLFYLRQNIKKIPAPPKILALEIVRGCNFNCEHCFSRLYPDLINQMKGFQQMSADDVHSILKDAWVFGCRAVTFEGLGEPTLHPDFYQFLFWAKEMGYSIKFTSNGWTLALQKLSILDNHDVVRISIDSMHVKGSPNPHIYLEKMKFLFNTPKKFKMIAVIHGEIATEIKTTLNENTFAMINYPLVKKATSAFLLKKRTLLIPCFHPWYYITVNLDLKIAPCPCIKSVSVGQIDEKIKLSEVWYGDEMNYFRNQLRSGITPDACKTCDRIGRNMNEWFQAFFRAP